MGPSRMGTDQVGGKHRAGSPEGYVRFRVRVADGKMSIVDSHLVPSALVQPSVIHGNFTYEVTEGEQRLHLDSIPDLGVVRSFANPSGPLEQQRHHTYELSTYEFDVRVPAESLTQADLRHVTIALYRVKELRPPMTVGRIPLSVQFQRELREVARLDGISSKALPELLQKPRTSPARRRGRKRK